MNVTLLSGMGYIKVEKVTEWLLVMQYFFLRTHHIHKTKRHIFDILEAIRRKDQERLMFAIIL